MVRGDRGLGRRPAFAAVMALVVPGLGHLYCGNLAGAIISAFVFFCFTSVFFLLFISKNIGQSLIVAFLVAGLGLHVVHTLFAWRFAKFRSANFRPRRFNHWYYYVLWWLTVIFLVLVIAFQIGDYRSFKTPSSSMESSLMWNERFIANMGAYSRQDPARGDAVVFICPCDGTTLYLKRCMGLPGDTIEIVDKKLFVNGVPVAEAPTVQFIDTTSSGALKIHPKLPGAVDSRDNYGPHEVPADQFFMIGDNRDNSYDSRYFGFVPRKMILAKALRIYYSSDMTRIGLNIE